METTQPQIPPIESILFVEVLENDTTVNETVKRPIIYDDEIGLWEELKYKPMRKQAWARPLTWTKNRRALLRRRFTSYFVFPIFQRESFVGKVATLLVS